jgi:hypothetical protein
MGQMRIGYYQRRRIPFKNAPRKLRGRGNHEPETPERFDDEPEASTCERHTLDSIAAMAERPAKSSAPDDAINDLPAVGNRIADW